MDYSAPSPLAGKEIPFSASSTDPCGDGSNQFATEAGGVRWKSFPITYAIDITNSGVDPNEARNAVIKGFDEFDAYIQGQTFMLINDFNTAEITFAWELIDGAGGALGITTFFYNPETLEIDSAEIVLDRGDIWFVSAAQSCAGTGSSQDIQNVATHELGHAVGLGHVSDNLLTMYTTSTAGETLKRSLGNGDRAGLNFLYPGWSQWSSLDGALRDNSDPVVVANSDGRLDAFVIGSSNNQLYHKSQNTPGGTTSWSQYDSLGGNIAPNTSPALASNSDGRLELFVIAGIPNIKD
ncbi:MAG: matrixin family metalloprotease, partial [Nitrososphaeraceae archaeon]